MTLCHLWKREFEIFLHFLHANLLDSLCNADHVPDEIREQIGQFLLSAITTGRRVPLDLERVVFGENNETNLKNGLEAIVGKLGVRQQLSENDSDGQSLPTVVTFPYSRHSSYPELCNLVGAFKPKDVWPCTVDLPSWLREGLTHIRGLGYPGINAVSLGITIENLFGEHCSGSTFRHDDLLKERFADRQNITVESMDSQVTVSSVSVLTHRSQLSPIGGEPVCRPQPVSTITGSFQSRTVPDIPSEHLLAEDELRTSPQDHDSGMSQPVEPTDVGQLNPTSLYDSQDSCVSELALEARFHAFEAMLENARGKQTRGFGLYLLSTTDNHSKADEILCEPSAPHPANALILQSASHHMAGTMIPPTEDGH